MKKKQTLGAKRDDEGRVVPAKMTQLKDGDVGFYENIVTYEGPDHMSVTEKVYSTYVNSEIEKAVKCIANHLFQQDIVLSHATFYFKYDRYDTLYLLFASNIY